MPPPAQPAATQLRPVREDRSPGASWSQALPSGHGSSGQLASMWDPQAGGDLEYGGPGGGSAAGMLSSAPPPLLLLQACERLVNKKRGALPAALRRRHVAAMGRSYPRDAGGVACVGHTRFATASLPAVRETHPHTWTPLHRRAAWLFRDGAFQLAEGRTVGCRLTHNGDAEAFSLFRETIGATELGLWLDRVLHLRNDARADSPKLAGMCDLLCCAGLWDASVRWAYQECVACSFRDATGNAPLLPHAPNTAPTVAWAAAWARLLDDAMPQAGPLLAHALGVRSARYVVGSVIRFVEAILALIDEMTPLQAAALGVHPACLPRAARPPDAQLPSLEQAAARSGVVLMLPLQLRKFLRRAAIAFTTQDATEALRLLLSRATGSFGLTLVSALEPDTVAIAAWGQQMSIGLHDRAPLALFASEAAAMKVPLRNEPTSQRPRIPAGAGKCEDEDDDVLRFCTHRLDLDDTDGEVVRLSLRPRSVIRNSGGSSRDFRGGTTGGDGGSMGSQGGGSLFGFTWQGLHLTSFRFATRHEEAPEMLRRRLVPLRGNPLVQPLPALTGAAIGDPVGADIAAIPQVLRRVRAEWQHADSLNRQSATAFARMLLEKMALNAQPSDQAAHERRDVDLLLVGVETSLWLAEQWASDVEHAMPRVAVRCLSANKVLSLLGAAADAAGVAGFSSPGTSRRGLAHACRNAVVLVVSQSGQTFPTLMAARLLRHACGNRVFCVTSEFDTKLGLAVGQDMARPERFCGRIFSNFSGWRPAEASTVATAAAHATLTELLLFMLHAYTLELEPEAARSLLGLTLTRDDARCAAELRDASSLEAIPAICLRADGAPELDADAPAVKAALVGRARLPGAHERLVAQGNSWAHHIAEGWHAIVFAALYVLVTITLQCAPFSLLSVAAGANAAFWEVCPADTRRCAIGFGLRIADSALYIWVAWLFLLARRVVRGEPVMARRGKRTLIVADPCPWVHQCVDAYVSKLFALAYGDNTPDVHSACAVDHLVHRYTHRVTRGVLIALGRPDGRVSAHARAEAATLLAAMQCAAIHNAGCGPEIVSIGHNPFQGDVAAVRAHVVLPTFRRLFMCEHVFRAVAGRTGAASASDPQSVLAELGRGHVVPFAALAAGRAAAGRCDRCGHAAAKRECLQCAQRFCAPCCAATHARGEARTHLLLGALATAAMRRAAASARITVLSRAGLSPGDAADEAPDAAASAAGAMGARGAASAGNAFPGFGARAAAKMLTGHGRAMHASGAPLGLHHARALREVGAASRARSRWRFSIAAVLAQRNPWRRLLLDLFAARKVGTRRHGAFASLNSIMDDTDLHSAAVMALEMPLKELYEGRFASLERCVAMHVMFHAMARRVRATCWPLPPWDMSRSQSILRVASTAAPVSGAEVGRALCAAGTPAPTAFVTRRRISVPRVSTADLKI